MVPIQWNDTANYWYEFACVTCLHTYVVTKSVSALRSRYVRIVICYLHQDCITSDGSTVWKIAAVVAIMQNENILARLHKMISKSRCAIGT
jgi:hypothetical protein